MTAPDVTVRPGAPEDLPAVAETFLAARAAAIPAMPPLARSEDEARAHLESLDLEDGRLLWVAEDDSGLTGYAVVRGEWLEDLYVRPEHARQGIGSMLLDVVKAALPDGFSLWVFATNRPARAFYAQHGLVELETTDGSGNAEGAPDVRTVWPGHDPLPFLRSQIDDVDDQLGDLLARRAALTAAVQPLKGSGERDPEREREIATRLAARVPALGPERVERIVHAIITESLGAAGD